MRKPEHLTNDLLALMPCGSRAPPRLSRRADYGGRRGRRGLLRRPMRAGPDPDLSGRAHRGGAAAPGFGSGRLTRGPRGDGHVFPLLQGLRPGLRCGHGRSDASGAPAEASAAGWGVPDGGAAEAPDRELAEADGPMVMLLGTTGPGSVSAVR